MREGFAPDDSSDSIGRFTLIRCLGRNSRGEVWIAEDGSDAMATIQFLTPDRKIVSAEGFRRQVLEHPNVVRTTEVSSDRDHVGYAAMEPFRGELLSVLLSREGSLPLDRAARIAVQVADAVEAAHAGGSCHGWIDEGCVLVSRDGQRVAVFGFDLEGEPSSLLDRTHRERDVPALCRLIERLLPAPAQHESPRVASERLRMSSILKRGRGAAAHLPSANLIATLLRGLEQAAQREVDRADVPSRAPRRPAIERRWTTVAAVAATVIVLIGASVALISTGTVSGPEGPSPVAISGAGPGPDTARVPTLTSSTVVEARALLLDAGFILGGVEPKIGPPGEVVGSQPSRGAILAEGTPITLIVGVEPDRLATSNAGKP